MAQFFSAVTVVMGLVAMSALLFREFRTLLPELRRVSLGEPETLRPMTHRVLERAPAMLPVFERMPVAERLSAARPTVHA